MSELVTELKSKGIDDQSYNKSSSIANDSGLSQKSSTLDNNSLQVYAGVKSNDLNHSSTGIEVEFNLSSLPSGSVALDHENVTETQDVSMINPLTSTPSGKTTAHKFSQWLSDCAIVSPLEGHNDIVCSVDAERNILMTGR